MSNADEVIDAYARKGSLILFGAVADEASKLWHDLRFNEGHAIPSPEFRGGLSFALDTSSGELRVNIGNGESQYNMGGRTFTVFSQGFKSFNDKGEAHLIYNGTKYELYKSRGLNIFVYSSESDSLIDAFSVDLFNDRSLSVRHRLSLSTVFLFPAIPDDEKVRYVLSLKDGDGYERKVAYEICSRYSSQYPKLEPLLIKMLWSGVGTEPDKKEALHRHQATAVPIEFRNLNLRYTVKPEAYSSRKIAVWADSESDLAKILSVCIQYGLRYEGFSSSDPSLKNAEAPAEWIDPGDVDDAFTVIYAGRSAPAGFSRHYSVEPDAGDSIFVINDRFSLDQEGVLSDLVDDAPSCTISSGYMYIDTLKSNSRGQIIGRSKLISFRDLSRSYIHGRELVDRLRRAGSRYIMQCWGGMGDDYRILGRLKAYDEAHGFIVHPIVTPISKDFLELYRHDGLIIERSDKADIITYIRISQDYDAPIDLVINDGHFDSIVTGKTHSFVFGCPQDPFSANLGIPPGSPFDRYHIPRADPELSRRVRGSILLVTHALFLHDSYETERFRSLIGKIVAFFSERGFKLYTNVVKSQQPVSGTEPLSTSISDLVSVSHLFSHVVSVSTGLVDVLINTPASISMLSVSGPSFFKKEMAAFCHHSNFWEYVLDEVSDDEIIQGIYRSITDQLPMVRRCSCACDESREKNQCQSRI